MMEFPILSVPFAQVDPVRMILAVIPLMVVAMVPIVVPMMIDPNSNCDFLASGRFWRRRHSKRSSNEQKAQIFACKVHVWSSVDRELQSWSSGL